ncbi:MAG TPA: hypothetical protein VEC36_01640, partial [Patescibacteria group bacterium]|nr:hypothetical protein [Patescibacteria group bacterium]
GDCKDRAYLVATLARKYGLHVDMATISTHPTPGFSGTGINQYNHVICSFEKDGKHIFFDPTDRYSAFGSLPESDIEGMALVLNAGKPQIIAVPPPNMQPSMDIHITGDLENPKGAAARLIFRNSYYSRAQYAQQELTGIDRNNYLEKSVNAILQKIAIHNPEFESETDSTVIYKAEADISGFIITTDSKKYIMQNAFMVADADVLNREKDTLGLYLTGRLNASLMIDLKTRGYSGESAQASFGEGNPVKFSAIAMPNAEGVQLRYNLSQSEKFLKGEKKANYLAFCKGYFRNKKNMFILTKREK